MERRQLVRRDTIDEGRLERELIRLLAKGEGLPEQLKEGLSSLPIRRATGHGEIDRALSVLADKGYIDTAPDQPIRLTEVSESLFLG